MNAKPTFLSRVAIGVVSALVLTCVEAVAQATPGPRVDVEAVGMRTDGSFDSATYLNVHALGPPGTYHRSFSVLSDGCLGGSAPYILNEAVAGWHVWVTPVSTEGDAATFRILWERSPNGNADAWNPGAEQTFTLKPGRMVPLDIISAPPRASRDRKCSATTLHVRVRTWPFPEVDRRLLSTTLSLIQRLPDGTERSHPLSVRGLYGHPTSFHFDTLEDRGVLLDVQGEFTARPDADGIVVDMTTTSRVVEGNVASDPLFGGTMLNGRVISNLRLAPDASSSVDLTSLAENGSGAVLNQGFSIRVRSRQIR